MIKAFMSALSMANNAFKENDRSAIITIVQDQPPFTKKGFGDRDNALILVQLNDEGLTEINGREYYFLGLNHRSAPNEMYSLEGEPPFTYKINIKYITVVDVITKQVFHIKYIPSKTQNYTNSSDYKLKRFYKSKYQL